ncbi:Epoxyqueuosine reductase [termite gut metagenome]|uniref:Epoxyqueuosine reductase n=1 Tax=termite gut metagenome TaxID=433724 RepID=A0A5J4RQB7_9ZZZZ
MDCYESGKLRVKANLIKAEALRLGFSVCGIAPAGNVGEDAQYLREWLAIGNQADMNYMKNHFEKRCDSRLPVEGARSVVSVALNYYPKHLLEEDQYQLAYYAYGRDYHEVMRRKLEALQLFINKELCPVNGCAFCDTAPVLERYWAWRAGLGSIGKNTQLIIPKAGSYFFLGELLLDRELEYDTPRQRESCGRCTRCLDACPAKALEQPYKLNARKCLSYLTIESRGTIPDESVAVLGNRIYGCDECQKACPCNRFAVPCDTPEFQANPVILQMRKEDWHKLTEQQYHTLFKGGALKRAKYEGLMRNIDCLAR